MQHKKERSSMRNQFSFFVKGVCTLGILFSGQIPVFAAELFTDPQFTRGFEVHNPAPGKHVKRGLIQPYPATADPAWVLAQWSCRTSLHTAKPEFLPDGSIRYADSSKAVTFSPLSNNTRRITFSLNGIAEYQGRLRDPKEPWIHLLTEQPIATHPSFLQLAELRFQIRCRLTRAESGLAHDQAKPWHAAQFLAYLTLQDRNRQSPHFGDFIWLGVPIYDSRYRQPKPHTAPDTALHKFIYNPPGSVYTTNSLHDGQWVAIDHDLLPLMREALASARQHGFLVQSKDADLQLGSLNLGWEIPGLWNVTMEFEGLSLQGRMEDATRTKDNGSPDR